MEIAGCMPVIIEALDRSSLDGVDKLDWALDTVLEDYSYICDDFVSYLHRRHPKSSWPELADRLLARLKAMKCVGGASDFSLDFARDRLSDWAIYSLERAGRNDEIIPLCETEAKRTCSYERLVKRLVAERRYEDAERWIREGLGATQENRPGIAGRLRDQLRVIRVLQKNWPAVASMEAEEFARCPSQESFTDCKTACVKAKIWTKVRLRLLSYLETGELPWKQKGWPLPQSSLLAPEIEPKDCFPILDELIDIAILEKKPDQVLYWYEQLAKKRFGWQGIDEDEIATAIQTYAPDQAVAIWKKRAEWLIAKAKTNAYREAAKDLRKAGAVMLRQKKMKEWEEYLRDLRATHARKRRLMEIMDGMEGKPIVAIKDRQSDRG